MAFGKKKQIQEGADPVKTILGEAAPLVEVSAEGQHEIQASDQVHVVPIVSEQREAPVPVTAEASQRPTDSPMVLLKKVLSRIDFLNSQFEDRMKYDEVRELQVNNLYSELESYKQRAQMEQMLDLARGIFLVLDKLEPESPFQMTLEHLREELVECLAIAGIERIDDPIEILDVPTQIVVGFLDESSVADSRIRQHGYRKGDVIVRPRHIETRKS